MTNPNQPKVLIVDDHRDVRTPIRLGLELSGFNVFEASDGKSAIEATESASPQVVIIDHGLPDMPGTEVGRKIKSSEAHKDVIIALLTGFDTSELRESAETSGFDQFFVKPISIRELSSWIQSVLSS